MAGLSFLGWGWAVGVGFMDGCERAWNSARMLLSLGKRRIAMKWVLLVSLKTRMEADWSLAQEIAGALKASGEEPWPPGGVANAGRDAVLFDRTIAFGKYVRACAHLTCKLWPYAVVEVDPASILAEGTIPEELKAILGR
jgi:hypothetical protein